MQITGYEFREGFVAQKGVKPDAAVVGKHLDFLRQHFKGELTPEDVLKDAERNNSPLHNYFEWDDTEAARHYRMQQARGLIKAVVAIYKTPEATREPVKIAAFTRIPEGDTSHYRATDHALSQTNTREVILKQAWNELQQWRRRYNHLREFADLVKAVDEAGEALKLAQS